MLRMIQSYLQINVHLSFTIQLKMPSWTVVSLSPGITFCIFRLMYRGASYADIMRYQRCIDLWRRALQIRIDKDTMLYTDTCFTAQALVRLMIDYNIRSNINKEDKIRQRFHDIISTFRLITTDIVGKFILCFRFICINFFVFSLLIYLVLSPKR